jgi:hypothetical protein
MLSALLAVLIARLNSMLSPAMRCVGEGHTSHVGGGKCGEEQAALCISPITAHERQSVL